MTTSSENAASEIHDLLKNDVHCDLRLIIEKHSIRDPEDVAFLIDVDARSRLDRGHRVSLDLYVQPLLAFMEHSVVLDAAIDMSLKSAIRSGVSIDEASGLLAKKYPDYAASITNSVSLSKALWSTSDVSPAPAWTPHSLPASFGPVTLGGTKRYRLEDEIASGSSGVVYRAFDSILSDQDAPATVAIKVFPVSPPGHTESTSSVDEAKKARRVSHPYVASVIDVGRTEDGQNFIVYEYVDGRELDKAAASLSGMRDIVKLVASIAEGVHAIHAAGLAHCDLKPSNILVKADLSPKIIDLGIAARSNEWDRSQNANGRGLGTLAFMSPQQYKGEPLGHSPPSDVWALGGILYWVLTGRLPSGQTVGEAQRTLQFGLNLRTWTMADGRSIPRDLRTIIDKALVVNPVERFASAKEFADALDAWREHKPIVWTKPSAFKVFRLWCQRRPVIAALALLVALGLIASIYLGAANIEERRWREESRGYYNYLREGSSKFNETDFFSKQLALVSIGEWFYGPLGFRDVKVEKEFVQLRLESIRERLQQVNESGEERYLEAILLESGLALWLVHDHQWRDAIPLIETSIQRWETVLDADDPWFTLMKSLADASDVDRLSEGGGQRSAKSLREDARTLAGRLESALPEIERTASGGAIRLIIYNRLGVLYGPDFLGDSAAMTAAMEIEKELRIFAGVR
jgi:serine/threonine protein kinase